MSEWSNNNLAHRYTWYITKRLGIHKRSFSNSQTLKLKQFDYYVTTATAAEKKQRAKTFAMILSNLYQDIGNATLEKNITHAKGIAALVTVLLDGEKTLMDLAATADTVYYFPGE